MGSLVFAGSLVIVPGLRAFRGSMFDAAAVAAFVTKAFVLRTYFTSPAVALAVVELFARMQFFHCGLASRGFAWLR